MQGALEWLGIPYTGSGVLASRAHHGQAQDQARGGGRGLRRAGIRGAVGSGRSAARARRHRPADDGQARLAGLERRHHQGEDRRRAAARLRGGESVDPVVFAERFIAGDEFTVGVLQRPRRCPRFASSPRPSSTTTRRSISATTRSITARAGSTSAAEAELQAAALATLSRDRLLRLGARRLHARGGERQVLFHRNQHDSRHDRSQLGAHGGAPRRDRFRGAGVARAGNQLSRGSANEPQLAHPPQSIQESREDRKARAGSGRHSSSSGAATRAARRSWRWPSARWPRSAGRSTGRCRSFRWTAAFSGSRPGRSKRRVAPYAHAGLHVGGSRRHPARRGGAALGRCMRESSAAGRTACTSPSIEQTAAARWGESGLLNTRGELFVRAAAHVPAELPRLSGPEGTESQVAQRYMSRAGPHAGSGHAHRGAAPR